MPVKAPKKKQQSYLEKLTEECNNKYKNIPKHQLRFVPLISPEFNLDYLVFKNKNNEIQFLDSILHKDPPYYIHNYSFDNQGSIPELEKLNSEHRTIMLKKMFSEDGYNLETFDWHSRNPKEGYYLCYYRKIGQNKWVYNFDIFEFNVYGHFNNLMDERSYNDNDIMSFVFLEGLY